MRTPDYAVLMTTPNNTLDIERLLQALEQMMLGECRSRPAEQELLPIAKAERAMSVREAFFRPHKVIPVSEVIGPYMRRSCRVVPPCDTHCGVRREDRQGGH